MASIPPGERIKAVDNCKLKLDAPFFDVRKTERGNATFFYFFYFINIRVQVYSYFYNSLWQ